MGVEFLMILIAYPPTFWVLKGRITYNLNAMALMHQALNVICVSIMA